MSLSPDAPDGEQGANPLEAREITPVQRFWGARGKDFSPHPVPADALVEGEVEPLPTPVPKDDSAPELANLQGSQTPSTGPVPLAVPPVQLGSVTPAQPLPTPPTPTPASESASGAASESGSTSGSSADVPPTPPTPPPAPASSSPSSSGTTSPGKPLPPAPAKPPTSG